MRLSAAAWGREMGRLEHIPFPVFRDEYFDYDYGQHAGFYGPTDCGKTTAMFQLMVAAGEQCPEVRPVLLVMKPDRGPKYRGRKATGDPTVARLVREYGGRIHRDWPLRPRLPWEEPAPIDVLWPRHDGDPAIDEYRHYQIFRRAILGGYKRGGHILGADEAYSLEHELGLSREIITVQTKGRSLETGVFNASQRTAHISLWSYQAQHTLWWKDNNANARKRAGELSGNVDWAFVSGVIGALPYHVPLYVHGPTGSMAVLD